MTTSSSKNPGFTYPDTGTYTVNLTVTLPSTKFATITKVIDVFQLSDTSFTEVVTGHSVAFTDTSVVPNIDRWEWNFGDLTGSSEQNPTHEYPYAYLWPVTLTVHTSHGGIGFTGHDVTTVDEVFPEFSFDDSADPDIDFFDESTGDEIISWLWDFGDGDTSIFSSPSHTYLANGTYTVRLTVSTLGGSSDYIEHDVVISSYITTWTHSFNFSSGNGAATAANNGTSDLASYTAATGWQDNVLNAFNQVAIFYNFGGTGEITQIDFTYQKSTTVGPYSSASAVTFSSPGVVNNTSGVLTTNQHQAISDTSIANNTSLHTYTQMFDGTTVKGLALSLICSGLNDATIKSLTVYGTGVDPF